MQFRGEFNKIAFKDFLLNTNNSFFFKFYSIFFLLNYRTATQVVVFLFIFILLLLKTQPLRISTSPFTMPTAKKNSITNTLSVLSTSALIKLLSPSFSYITNYSYYYK